MVSCLRTEEGGNPSQLLSKSEEIPGMLCLVLRLRIKEGQNCTGERPAKGHKDAEGMGASLL